MIEQILMDKLLRNACCIDKCCKLKQFYLLLESTFIYVIVKLYRMVK